MQFIVFYILLLVFIHSLNTAVVSLYKANENVVILTKENIYEKLSDYQHPTILLFYVDWCGHCQRFAPIYSNFAKEFVDQPLNIAAINCNYNDAAFVCNKFKIRGYPTLKKIPPRSKSPYEEPGKIEEIRIHKTPENLRNYAIKLIFESNEKFKNLNPNLIDLKNFEKQFQSHFTENLVVVFDEDLNLGAWKSVMLATSNCTSFDIRLVKNKNNMLAKKFFVEDFPAILTYPTSEKSLIIAKDDPHNITYIKLELYNYFKDSCLSNLISHNKTVIKSDEPTEIETPPVSVELDIKDLVGAVSQSLRLEINYNIDTPEKFKIATDWINMITKCIPWPQQQHNQLNMLQSVLSSPNEMNVREALNNFIHNSNFNEAFPATPEFVNCKGSDAQYRGYPCSMWTLFHTATFICEEKDTNVKWDALGVFELIHSYVSNFFSCLYCRKHFLNMTEGALDRLKTNEETVRALWNFHNVVNSRLREDNTSDPMFPKVQFPSDNMCPKCKNVQNPRDAFVAKPGYGTDDITWNWPETKLFLKHFYSADNIRVEPLSNKTTNTRNIDEVFRKFKFDEFRHLYNSTILRFSLLILIAILLFYINWNVVKRATRKLVLKNSMYKAQTYRV